MPCHAVSVNTSPEFKGIKTVFVRDVVVVDDAVNTSPEFKGIKTISAERSHWVFVQ